jgi:hypothetical protein
MSKLSQPITLDRPCLHCGQPIVVTYTDVRHKQEALFCGMACYHAHRRKTVGSVTRICPRCGQEHHNKQVAYCLACRRILAAESKPPKVVDERYSRVCPVCGVTFCKPASIAMKQWNEHGLYCSRTCAGKARRKAYDTCEACGKPITTEGVKRGAARYCSRKCYADARSNFTPFTLCEVCGETVERRHRRFCSVECFNEWHRGPNHPAWIEGQPTSHSGQTWERFAATIRERDQVCRHCGKPPKLPRPLDVHHIIPWPISHDNSPENLIALCRSCHKKADRQYRQTQQDIADQVRPCEINRQSP